MTPDTEATEMFKKDHLDALYGELRSGWYGKPAYEQLIRDAHLGITLYDVGRSLDEIDPIVVSLIWKHKPEDSSSSSG